MALRFVASLTLGLCVWSTSALADGPYRMATAGGFELSFIQEAIEQDPSGRLSSVDLQSAPGSGTGPEVIAILYSEWASAERTAVRRNDTEIWPNLQPVADPALIVRRTDFERDDGAVVRVYIFVAFAQGTEVPRDCQAAFVAADFASDDPIAVFTIDDCRAPAS